MNYIEIHASKSANTISFWSFSHAKVCLFAGLIQKSSWERSLHRKWPEARGLQPDSGQNQLASSWLRTGYSASLLFYFTSQWQISVSLKDTHIFLLDGALFTVVCIRDSWSSTDDTAALVGAIVTLITDAHQGARPHVGITDHTFAITWGEQQIRLSSWSAMIL